MICTNGIVFLPFLSLIPARSLLDCQSRRVPSAFCSQLHDSAKAVQQSPHGATSWTCCWKGIRLWRRGLFLCDCARSHPMLLQVLRSVCQEAWSHYWLRCSQGWSSHRRRLGKERRNRWTDCPSKLFGLKAVNDSSNHTTWMHWGHNIIKIRREACCLYFTGNYTLHTPTHGWCRCRRGYTLFHCMTTLGRIICTISTTCIYCPVVAIAY